MVGGAVGARCRIGPIIPNVQLPGMPKQASKPFYLLRWDFSRRQSLGKDIVTAEHRLNELPFGSRQGLQDLLQKTPGNAVSIYGTGKSPAYPNEWQRGEPGSLAIAELVNALKLGRLWITLSDIDQHNASIARVSQRLAAELQECHVGLRILDPSADLILSSATTQYYFGCDPTPTVHFQLAGKLRLTVYPCEERYVQQDELEQIASRGQRKQLYYEPAFDRSGSVVDLEPGQLFCAPHTMPYRIEACDAVNVCFRMRFRTRRSIRQTNVLAMNRLLKPWIGDRFCGDRLTGVRAALKQLCAALLNDTPDAPPQSSAPTFALPVVPKTCQFNSDSDRPAIAPPIKHITPASTLWFGATSEIR